MATYNGGQFIENQILSLISQTYKNWNLIIHDDGSKDETLEIVKKYQELDSRIHLVEDGVKCGGAAKNFLYLLKKSSAPYIIFSDQDDIWMESKLEVLFNKIKDIHEPCAVYCNAYAYNGIKITANEVSLIKRTNLKDSLFLNSGVQGCSLMFNRYLLNLLKDYPDYVHMHDHYITIGAVTFGKLHYIQESLMLYRQHNNNVTGNVPVNAIDRAKSFIKRTNPIIDRKHYNANKSFFEKYHHHMNEENRSVFKVYFSFPDLRFFQKIMAVIKNGFKIGNSSSILIIKILFKNTI